MVTFIIVRHGYSMYNKERRFTGQSDIPLDPVGISQAHEAAKYISENYKIDKVYSSDLSRAADTALPTAQFFGLPVIKRCDLREMDLGTWTGRLLSDVEKENPEAFEAYFKDIDVTSVRGGENHSMLITRATRAIDEIAAENDGKSIAIFTHGGVIRALHCVWQGFDANSINNVPRVPNASITVAVYNEKNADILLQSYTDHLSK
ncbi:MAG: histidine phosphatase family protein [Clostridia bacterium]|nr:histidine phosphatase family protein [Clostridia bacterium]